MAETDQLVKCQNQRFVKKYNIQMTDGLGDKIRSSSDLTGLTQI